jgi:hypothetical protein
VPQLIESHEGLRRELLVSCPYFNVERVTFERAEVSFQGCNDGGTFEIWGILSGQSQVIWAGEPLELAAIRFVLLPARLGDYHMQVDAPAVMLRAYVPG